MWRVSGARLHGAELGAFSTSCHDFHRGLTPGRVTFDPVEVRVSICSRKSGQTARRKTVAAEVCKKASELSLWQALGVKKTAGRKTVTQVGPRIVFLAARLSERRS